MTLGGIWKHGEKTISAPTTYHLVIINSSNLLLKEQILLAGLEFIRLSDNKK